MKSQLKRSHWLQGTLGILFFSLFILQLLTGCGGNAGNTTPKNLTPQPMPTAVSTNSITVTVVGSPTVDDQMHGTCIGTVIDIRNFADGDHVRVENDSCGNSQIVIPASIPDQCPKGASISYTPTGDSSKTGLPVAVYYGCKTEISG